MKSHRIRKSAITTFLVAIALLMQSSLFTIQIAQADSLDFTHDWVGSGSNSVITIPYDSKLEAGVGAFTLEMWVKEKNRVNDSRYKASFWSSSVIGSYGSGTPGSLEWGLNWDCDGFAVAHSGQSCPYMAGRDDPAAGSLPQHDYYTMFTDQAWHHIALSKTAELGEFSFYIDGLRVSHALVDNDTWWLDGGDLNIGGGFDGLISNVRFVKGQGLYTGANITVPTSKLTTTSQGAIASNVMLLLNSTGSSCQIEDSSSNHFTIQNAGVVCNAATVATTYGVQYDNQGHGTKPADDNIVFGQSITTLPAESDDGYFIFQGWAETPTATILPEPYTPTSDQILYAIWQDTTPFACGTGTYQVIAGVATNGSTCTGSLTIDSSATAIDYEAFMGSGLTDVVIPDSVLSIDERAFYSSLSLTSVTVGTGVTSIGNSAFNSAATLSSITFNGSSLTSLGDDVFSGTGSLTSISLPNGFPTIGINLFRGSGITSFDIPASVTTIKNDAFRAAALTTLTIPNTVTTIKEEVMPTYPSSFPVTFNLSSSETYTYNILNCGNNDPCDSYGANLHYELVGGYMPYGIVLDPETGVISGTPAENGTFNPVFEITYGDGTTAQESSFTFVVSDATQIPIFPPPCFRTANMTVITDGSGCSGELIIPDEIVHIANNAFNINVYPNTVTSIVFSPTSHLTSIGTYAFQDTSITSINIPSAVTLIGDEAFGWTGALQTFTFEAGSHISSIRPGVFNNSSLATIDIPASAYYVGSGAFTRSAMSSVTLHEGLKTIRANAFSQDGDLDTITIPASVTAIETGAFNTSGLSSITFSGGVLPEIVGGNTFDVTDGGVGGTLDWNTLNTGLGVSYRSELQKSPPDAPVLPAGPLDLYAIWTHTVTFKANGGTGSDTTQSEIGSTALTSHATLGFTNTGFVFDGWTQNSNGSGDFYADGASYLFNTDTNLYAKWALPHGTVPTIVNLSIADATTTLGANFTLGTSTGTTAVGATALNNGKIASQSKTGDQLYGVTVNYTTYAYVAPTHSVTYELGYIGGIAPTQANVSEGSRFEVAANPTRVGHIFTGWVDGGGNVYGGPAYIATSYLMSTSAVILTAHWESLAHPITRTVHHNGASSDNWLAGFFGNGVHTGIDVVPGWCVVSGDGFDSATWVVSDVSRSSNWESLKIGPAGTRYTYGGAYEFSPDPAITISTGASQTAVAGTSITSTVVSNSKCVANNYSITPSLPDGLFLDASTGVITGIPTNGQASATYTLQAERWVDATGALNLSGTKIGYATATFTLVVKVTVPTIVDLSIADATTTLGANFTLGTSTGTTASGATALNDGKIASQSLTGDQLYGSTVDYTTYAYVAPDDCAQRICQWVDGIVPPEWADMICQVILDLRRRFLLIR